MLASLDGLRYRGARQAAACTEAVPGQADAWIVAVPG